MSKRMMIVLIILLTTSIIMLILSNKKLFSQTIVIGAGAEMNLGTGTDICSSTYGNISGNITGNGTNCTQAMPVEMMSFYSSVNKSNVTLSWQTSSEENNRGFEIYRSENNNRAIWYNIGFVKGNGTKPTPTNYAYTDNKLKTGKYYYRLKQVDNNGNMQYYELNNVAEILPPNKFELLQNYPNPFNPVTKISFYIASDSKVNLKIYDISGKMVNDLINDKLLKSDYYTYEFNAVNLASGVYFYRLVTDKFTDTKKMVVLK
jgi:hypothetical protein